MRDISIVRELMNEFAVRTGLTDREVRPRRYLWTDAFAVCNFLELHRETEGADYLERAMSLVAQVHRTLGRHRDDDRRNGWISGLDEDEGGKHPTRGGLRIGKAVNERGADEPFDERLEWERDGQYFHYLTKWMHALDCVARITRRAEYARWALELAKTAHAAFTARVSAGPAKRMFWKMSIDLSRPLVSSMGQHDPLDGLITCEQLRATAATFPGIAAELDLGREIRELAAMCEAMDWATDDPLGIGGLLADGCRLTQLIISGALDESDMLETILAGAEMGLEAFARQSTLNYPAEHRLAFRELGLSIGLHALAKTQEMTRSHEERFARPLHSRLRRLGRFLSLAAVIEDFWLESPNRESRSWTAHLDINSVMLATSLAPDGYLILQ